MCSIGEHRVTSEAAETLEEKEPGERQKEATFVALRSSGQEENGQMHQMSWHRMEWKEQSDQRTTCEEPWTGIHSGGCWPKERMSKIWLP